nr:E3 ubiquitin-protein ligase listerin [Leptinotarsa decemlineata]
MGGKHKVANRTKNNARPSSSGRSAEFLGSSIPQFVGFSGLKDSTLGFCLATTDDLDASVDPNVQVILKKITKKDHTTKIKGLQELAELIKTSEPEAVKSMLLVWPRFYNTLVTDIDNGVREATHNVHHQIVLKAKRNIAPYLKQLMAPWFTSQYDTYPPAASIASQAFKDCFPPNKIQDAIAFCQEEILTYLSDNLLVQTAQSLSSSKQVSPEEAEAKYERVLISCLQGYCLYLEKVSVQHIESATALNNGIISNGKFWKLAKHKVAHIRAAWFKTLSVLCQKAPFLLEGRGSQVVGSVFGNLEEGDPTVLPCVWETTLLTMSTIKEWWTFINIDKLFLPKLWKILKQGGRGNATVIYPSLLPMISHLPPSVDENLSLFYDSFFGNLCSGFKQKSALASKSESAAIANALIECLQYVILKKQDNSVFCKNLIKTQLLTHIEWCLLEDQTSYKTIFNQVASLLQNWSRNSGSEALNSYLQFFFENLRDLFKDILFNLKECPNYDAEVISNKQVEFLQSLKHFSKPKKHFKVTFCSDDTGGTEFASNHQPSIVESDKHYFQQLNQLVYRICEDYVEYIEEKQCKMLFQHLYSLIVDFDAQNFFLNLSEKKKKKDLGFEMIDIYNNLLIKWLQSKNLSSKHVVSLIFLLMKYVSSNEKKMMLTTLSEVVNEECLTWCISEALAYPHNEDPLVISWFRNEKVRDFIVSIVDKEIRDECSPELSVILKLALTENEKGELFIEEEAVSQIISKLVAVIDNYTTYPITADTCVSLAAYISAIVYTENLLLTYTDTLLLALFRLSCTFAIDNEIISTETMYEVNSAWQDATSLLVKILNHQDSIDLTSDLADIIEKKFLADSPESSHLDHLVSVIVNTLRAIYRSAPLSLSDFMMVFLDRNFLDPWKSWVNNICKMAEYVCGKLSSPYEQIICDPSDEIQEMNVAKYFAWMYLKSEVSASTLEEVIDEYEDEDENEECQMGKAIVLNVIDKNAEYVAQILHDLSVSQSYLDIFKNTKCHDLVSRYYVQTETKLKWIVERMDDTFKLELKKILRDRAMSLAWFWCRAVYIMYTKIFEQPLNDIYADCVQIVTETKNLGVLHLTQIFSHHLNYDYIQNNFDVVGDVIVLNSLLHCDEIDVQVAEVVLKIERIRADNVPQFLCDNYSKDNISWEKSQQILEIIRLCSSLMKLKFSSLRQRDWDFSVLSLVSWASNCLKARAVHGKHEFQALLVAVVKLYVNIDSQVKKMKEQSIRISYIDEWEDVLVESVHGDLAQIWLYLAEQLEQKQDTIIYLPLIQEFGKLLNAINCDFLFKINDTSLPKWTKFLKRSCSLLVNRQPNLQVWGYRMLLILVPGLIKIDTEAVNMNTPHKKGLIFEQFKEKLAETHEIVNSMLMGFKLGEDSCRVEPSTDSFTYTFGYLLIWDVLLSLCNQSSTELRFQYADWLRNEDLFQNLLNNLFHLMPTEILHYNERKAKPLIESFFKKPHMGMNDTFGSEKIEHLVCWLYSSTLVQLPALVRQWWTSLDSKLAQVVEKVTQIYVSPHLVAQEFNDLITHQSKFKNMVLKVMPGAREVIAIYTVDEAQVELLIVLPPNYPLGGLDVQCNKQIAGTGHKQWLLQLKKCVVHQNGRIWDGLSLWNNNLDRKFDGVEECYICFSVLHPGTYQLPKLSCQTCKKKFHSACLYKWFRTSYKSSCPICRNLF